MRTPKPLPGHTLLMDCARCGREMTRECDAELALKHGLLVFKGRVNERPYCRFCYRQLVKTDAGGEGEK